MTVTRKVSRKSECTRLRGNIRDFCEHTAIHGLHYTVKNGTTIVEKLVWFFVILSAASFSIYMCYAYWLKSVQLPLLTSFNSTNADLSIIPFPAFTICSVNKFSQKKLNETISKFSKYGNFPYDKWQKVLRAMTSPKLLNLTLGNETFVILREFENSNISLPDILYVMKQTKVECEDIIVRCEWLGKPENCSQLFTGRLSDDGYACTFNANETKKFIPQINETAQEEYLNGTLATNPNANGGRNLSEVEFNTFKKFYDSKTAGLFGGLTVMLDGRKNDYSVTTSDFDGFRLLLHDSTEFPDIGERGFIIGLDSQVHIGIQCTVVTAEKEVLKVGVKDRNCYIENERQLQEFKSYSASNCKLECMTNITMNNASCRPYFYPVRHHHSICNVGQLENLSQILRNLISFEKEYLLNFSLHPERQRMENLCPHCLPTCDNKIYGYRLSRAPFPGSTFFRSQVAQDLRNHTHYKNLNDSAFMDYIVENVVSVSLYYEEPTCMAYKMEVRYGWDDFVASMGGILGLGMGFSAITVFECLYFFCVRRFLPKSPSQHLKPPFLESNVAPPPMSSPDSLLRRRRHKNYQIMPTSYSSHTKAPPTGYVLQPVALPIFTTIPVIPSWLAGRERN